MSDPNVEACSYLRVDHDFEYRTNDGRQIVIKKDEKLCLVQKTNDDWWKVVRNKEQRSFYVPVTYVRELPVRNPQDEENDGQIFEGAEQDSSAKRKHVEKWLSNTMDISHGVAEGPESLQVYKRSENLEDACAKQIGNTIEQQKQSLVGAEKKDDQVRVKGEKSGLERFRNVVRKLAGNKLALEDQSPHAVSARNSQISDGLQTFVESDCPVYSPKSVKELGQSFFDHQTASQHQIPHCTSPNGRGANKRSNSMDSVESSNDVRNANFDFVSATKDPKAAFNEELSFSVQKNSAIKRYSNGSTDRRLVKPNIEKKPSSPLLADEKTPKLTVSVSPQSTERSDYSNNAMKILNDKRKSWAVEELMTELTQIRKERVDDNTSNFVLRSVEIKDRFDPLEKLTQELHDLHSFQNENPSTLRLESKNHDDTAPRNESREVTGKPVKGVRQLPQSKQRITESTIDKSISPKTRISPTNEARSIQVSPGAAKSSKRRDEFEEANILNDASIDRTGASDEGSDEKVSLSADKERYLSAYHEHSQLFKSDIDSWENFEKPSYSNISIKLENEAKIRPELKLKIKSVDTKIKLTPSLEKLASEIQFLPASRTSVIDNDKQQSPLTRNHPLPTADLNDQTCPVSKKSSLDDNTLINVSEEREMWKNFKSKLSSKSSFKSKQEDKSQIFTKDVSSEEGDFQDFAKPVKTNLKKSATFNCVAVPEYYKHFQRHYDPFSASVRAAKRSSRSLEDMRVLVNRELKATLAAAERSEFTKNTSGTVKPESKPIPTRRTVKPLRNVQGKVGDELSTSRKGSQSYLPVLPPTLMSKSYENLSPGITNLKVFDANKSTAVSFKNLLCTSDSGSDEYLHYKAFPKSSANRNERSTFSSDSKINNNNVVSSESLPVIDRSLSDEQILSSNISSEALFSQSESEVYAMSEFSNTSSPVTIDQDKDNFVDLPPGWTQEYDAQSKQICFVNVRGEKEIICKRIRQLDYKWLTVHLEERMFQDFECHSITSMFSTFDWLRDIRFQCTSDVDDLLDSNNVPSYTEEEWFSSNDGEGKIYFFKENSNESSWQLPSVTIIEPTLRNMEEKPENVELRLSSGSEKARLGKARSLLVGHHRPSKKEIAARRSGSLSHDWPQLFDGNMCILKEGTLQRTKITENGKRVRKNWSTSYVVLSELFLLFFKDAKAFAAMKSGQSATAKPDISVDLNGATVESGEKTSSRKNVHMISTILGLQVLIQSDNSAVANQWFQEICHVIKKLPPVLECPYVRESPERSRDAKSKLFLSVNSVEESKVVSKIGRSRSIKINKKTEGSTEDLSGSSAEGRTKIKAKLKRFFQRRPTMDALVKNGIYKDEPAFGSYLADVCSRQSPMVPQFVKDCIKILERNPENMKADGLYRASGNLSQIQKIRLQVDQNNLDILEQEEDVHVLTGALKLFFRELKEPLIPYEFFEKALKGSTSKKKSDRIQIFREIVRGLSQPHYDTLQFLLQHLLKVTMYQEYNRMHIPNLAIVFGPTLMWPAIESANMALDLMQQNLVIECLLSEYDKIFK